MDLSNNSERRAGAEALGASSRPEGSVPLPANALFGILAGALELAACGGTQSLLEPGGRGAEQIAQLFTGMAIAGTIIWLILVGVAIYSIWVQPEPHHRRTARLFIAGGALIPAVLLGVLVAYGLILLPDLIAPAPQGSLKVAVSGEQWWWRVRYMRPGGPEIELANEIRLPVGEPVQFELEAADVIHSFWIPSLGGKVDMIPGRKNRLALYPTRTGVFRGACAEYCGASHALMNFYAVVEPKAEFDEWLARQSEPAQPPKGPLAERGQTYFMASGCGACHTVRGTPADGRIGPDLTHIGSRLSIAAGVLPKRPDSFVRWIRETKDAKPGAHMPAFEMLPQGNTRALAAYLDGLE